MKAVILAGGVRSGLELPGSNLPRALWPFPSEPLITEVIRFLRSHGVSEVAICANGKTRMIAEQLSSGPKPWLDLHYAEDGLPRGPAGCLRDLTDWLGEDDFIAIQGTGYYDLALPSLVAEHQTSGAALTVAAQDCGDGPSLEPAGIYVVNPKTLSLINPVGYQDIKEQFIPRLLQAKLPVKCHQIRGKALLIHSVDHYLAALSEVMPQVAARQDQPMVEREPGVWVHPTASVDPAARLAGPVWVDANARIEAGAVVAGPVVLATGAYVAEGAIVHRSVVMRGASIGQGQRMLGQVATPGQAASRRVTMPVARAWKSFQAVFLQTAAE